MTTKIATPSSGIAKVVEHQLRNWEIAKSQFTRSPRQRKRPDVFEFVAISRQVGSGGSEVGKALSKRLEWPLFDRQILMAMAENDELRARVYESMDERDLSWVENAVDLFVCGQVRRSDYFLRLSETVLSLARQGPAIFLGRGADQILPRDQGVRVRLYAPQEYCVANYAKRAGVTPRQSQRAIERLGKERAVFMRHHFRRGADDMTRFDLAINLASVTVNQAVDLVAELVAARTSGR